MSTSGSTLTTRFQGVGVNPGRVIATVRHMPERLAEPLAGEVLPAGTDPTLAIAGLKVAAMVVHDDLKERASRAREDGKAVLEAAAMMAKDTMLLKTAGKLITTGTGVERAVWEAAADIAAQFRALGGYMAERATDVLDVRARIVAELRGVPAPGIPISDTPFILMAEDLAPADTVTLDTSVVLALATSGGGPQSHTAIIARSLGLPAVVAAEGIEVIAEGSEVYVDGAAGVVVSAPGDTERQAAARWAGSAATLASFDGRGAMADGHLVPLLANVGNARDAAAAAAMGAQGVGLFRTEFCFLERDSEPVVEEQAAAYRAVFAAFPGRKVVVRTLDAGADKPLPFLTDTTEPNPALGVRGYRTDRTTPGVLKRQLSAIALAAHDTDADVWVMAPMIATRAEAAQFAELCAAAGLKTPGIMVEVPSAALTADSLLREVEFASLGTNDLTQYVMAADRMLGPLAGLNDPWQPALLRLVQLTIGGAKAAGDKAVGVCGESAGDPALAVVLAGLGVNSLSMTARSLGAVGKMLNSVTLMQAKELASLAVNAASAAEGRGAVRARLPMLAELGL
ncbi:phosphoenolpyruvate--protein phosphotransferase [Paenarthrobacter nicotinovorans]|uniref:phosphoenolpyruvate--protein phosphotransferase n=1 Tax=Paenarthrobacter nicotinovorans TaxID=29320 RepID=UPI00380B0233